MNRRTKAIEIGLIKNFLKLKGCAVLKVISHERPDAMVFIRETGKREKVAIEHTEYHVDAPPGRSSPGRKVHSFWHDVQSSICKRVSHRPHIQHMTGVVFFQNNKLPHVSKARDLAAELVRLCIENPIAPSNEQTINNFSDKYPLLKNHVREVGLIGTDARCVSWECANAIGSSIGVTANEIASIIQNKIEEFPKYCWGNAKERWLLISASGLTVFNSAGGRPEDVDWGLPTLQSACRSADVDRIFFWDRMYNWYKEVWPGAPVVHHGWGAKELCQ